MNNIFKRVSLLFVATLTIIMFSTISVNAESTEQYAFTDGYIIESYDVDIIVNENNTFDITENITAYYSVEKHGIYRKIPLNNSVIREDGTVTSNRARISDVSVDSKYTVSKSDGYYEIKIGDADVTLIGEQSYEISYNYNIGEDPLDDCDEFYFNIIGDEWDTIINNVTFTITMPKEFDPEKLGFTSGHSGSSNTEGVTYTIDGNTIKGSYLGYLSPGEALTVRLELEDGYFVDAGIPIDKSIYVMFLVPIICTIIAALLWLKFGKDDKTVPTVEFYPPENYNSLEIGFLYKGKAENEDVVSLLIYLANKGYIQIVDTEERALFSKSKSFKIVKLKDYDGNNLYERTFLEGLFECRNGISATQILKTLGRNLSGTGLGHEPENKTTDSSVVEVTASQLTNNFYVTMKQILSDINTKENRHHIFEKSTSTKSVIVVLMILASLFTILAVPSLAYGGISETGMTLFLALFYTPFYAVMFIKNIGKIMRIFWGGFTIMHSLIFFSSMPVADVLFSEEIYLFGFLCGIVCIAIMIICFKAMPKRTPYGTQILGKIEGFKTFLETTEKERLETLVMDNPAYFYDILPYTYVLGISEEWISKFETIAIEPPTWYHSPHAFTVSSFGAIMHSTMKSANQSMSSSPSGSSSGGSSGGGSSGGGSGGGGGGSW